MDLTAFFEPLLGQSQAVELLTQAVAKKRVSPAYFFVGIDGVGRSLAARCFVHLLFAGEGEKSSQNEVLKRRIFQGNHPDFLWVEPTYLHQGNLLSAKEAADAGVKRKARPQIRLEQIREIGQFLSRPALEAPRTVVAVEGAETMAEGAANGLLKTLEEPGNATIILMAPATDSILPTLVSRCQKVPFSRLTMATMKEVLAANNFSEILQEPVIMELAQGSPGAAIESWQQWQSIDGEFLKTLCQLPKNPRRALEMAKEIEQRLELETQLWLVSYLQHFYWQKPSAEGVERFVIEQLEQVRKNLLAYAQPRLVWECALVEVAARVGTKNQKNLS